MFTGLISDIGTILQIERQGELRAHIRCAYPLKEIEIGESIACSGACLTVIALDLANNSFMVEISQETIDRTATRWQAGTALNLERSLRLSDRLGGHLVTGHVDGIATIASITPVGQSHELAIDAPPELARFIAAKGSVTLDGVSLTVNRVEADRFWVMIIPYTWQHTTFGMRQAGDAINLEIDIIARYAERLLTHKAI